MTSLKRFGMLWLVAVAFSSFAQFVSLTPKVGMGVSGFSEIVSFKNQRLAPKLGVATEFRLSDKYSLKAELFWGEQRLAFKNYSRYDPSLDSLMYEGKLIARFNHLIFPLSLQKNFGRNRNWFWSVGAYTAYLLSIDLVYKHEGRRFVEKENLEHFHRMSWGASAGLGLKLPITDKNKLVIELKGNLVRHDNAGSVMLWLLLGYEFGRRKS